jgi:hypothetical protein
MLPLLATVPTLCVLLLPTASLHEMVRWGLEVMRVVCQLKLICLGNVPTLPYAAVTIVLMLLQRCVSDKQNMENIAITKLRYDICVCDTCVCVWLLQASTNYPTKQCPGVLPVCLCPLPGSSSCSSRAVGVWAACGLRGSRPQIREEDSTRCCGKCPCVGGELVTGELLHIGLASSAVSC